MNLSFLSGGFLFFAIVGVWMFIFVPSWSERKQFRETVSTKGRSNLRRSNRRNSARKNESGSARARARASQVSATIDATIAESLINKGAQANTESAATNPRAWTPNEIPSQLFRSHSGTLNSAPIADVIEINTGATRRATKNVEIEEISTETASINLDEILRRRRANG